MRRRELINPYRTLTLVSKRVNTSHKFVKLGSSETAKPLWYPDAVVDHATELLVLKKVGQFNEATPRVTMMMFNQPVQQNQQPMGQFTQFCGIDVSKDSLDFFLSRPENPSAIEQGCIPNSLACIAEKFADSSFDNTLFIVEHTGNYSSKVLFQLTASRRSVSVVNPFQSKSYMAFQGVTNKNDKQAARSLSIMGQQAGKLRLYKAPTEDMQLRKERLTALAALEKQQRMLKNQLHALEQLPVQAQDVRQSLEAILRVVESEIRPLRDSLCELSKTPGFDQKKKHATSIIGIGDKTAEALLLATNGLDDFETCEQVSKFLGVTPGSHYSGSSIRKKGGISKFGSGDVRSLLYMCTRSAIRYNLPCKELYQRLRRNGKSHKVAAVAVMHTLIKQVFACVKNESLFDNQHHLKNEKKM
jgi:transposase